MAVYFPYSSGVLDFQDFFNLEKNQHTKDINLKKGDNLYLVAF